jgi:uncharacterized protein
MGAPITHVEINSAQQKELLDFYSKLFGWHVDTSNPMGYAMIDTHADKGIGAGIGEAQNAGTKGITFFVDVSDLKATLDKVKQLGGRVLVEPVQTGPVTIARFADPEGNVIGLAKGM